MIIKRVEVFGLLGRDDLIQEDFRSDLNITTGQNGSGKTTLLKLIWYIISGNVQHALQEIAFKRATVWTDLYRVTIIKVSENTCRAEFEREGDVTSIEDVLDEDSDTIEDARDVVNGMMAQFGSSLFFPTFRRIEGGFTIQNKANQASNALFNIARPKGDLQESVLAVSRRLSNGGHTFVTSISTVDVVELLLRRYTELSEEANSLQRRTSQEVVDRIKDFRRESDEAGQGSYTPESAESVLDNIRATIEEVDRKRNAIMAPLQAMQLLGAKMFQHAGIKIGNRFSFGDAANAVNSETLSAGEKQMLSFISYNALTESSVVFIDEPELSLHVDWQRQLFPTLLSQGSGNQFIIATHSPFIYSKYPDKEIMLGRSRGDSEEEIPA